MHIKDRIGELRRVPAKDLLPDPKIWRTHGEKQFNSLRGVLSEISYADALLARETPDGLHLLDGHLRAETTGDGIIPVLVLDVTDEESDKIFASHDPVAAMATVDSGKLGDLLATPSTQSEAVEQMLKDLAELNLVFGGVAEAEMPALPIGEKADHKQITFSLSTEQATTVRDALRRAELRNGAISTARAGRSWTASSCDTSISSIRPHGNA